MMARTAGKVANRTAKKVNEVANTPAAQDVESRLIKLAEQLGWFAGTVKSKADGLMDNETLKQQLTQIRDGASTILDQVNKAGSAASESATKLANAAKAKLPGAAAKKAEAEKQAAAAAKRMKSRAPASAPGKKHLKPPPSAKVERRASQPATPPVILKPMPNRQRRGVR